MRWRIIFQGRLGSAENMAIDEALMIAIEEGKSLPTIRFYDWEPATVSCGFNQKAKEEVDFAEVEKKGYGFVRRPTGGRVVLHKDEVTYAVITPCIEKFEGGITDTYAEISKALGKGLLKLGVPIEFEKGDLTATEQRLNANPCFTSTSRYELKCFGKKIVGSAQVRKGNMLLQHGSILLNQNQEEVAWLVPGLEKEKKEKLARFLARKTISINQAQSRKIEYSEAIKALAEGFMEQWDSDEFIVSDELTAYECKLTAELKEKKYGSDNWNFRK
ncbi:MAG: lipoate--protein ligase family protein [Candidatus Cloacimonetes bacterium]|nr:lipoate--protein ligase family protein [Candidatus Cloacimonadota bacterium]